MRTRHLIIAVLEAVLLLFAGGGVVVAQSNFVLHTFGPYGQSGTNVDFVNTNSDGMYPNGWLTFSGATLYGSAQAGGTNSYGTLFAINTNGTFRLLYTFPADPAGNTSGAQPNGGLVLSNTNLYGTTAYGGANDQGVIFSISTNGTGIQVLHGFAAIAYNSLGEAANSDGANPTDGLVLAGGRLYGTAPNGGNDGNGVVFACNTNTAFTVLHQFTAVNYDAFGNPTNSDGANPSGQLLLSGTMLYGTTYNGGTNGLGTIFAINTNGTGFTVLHHFDDNDNNGDHGVGSYSSSGLVLSRGTLFGMGGTVLYALNTNGTGFAALQQFDDYVDTAIYAASGLTVSNGILFGVASSDGDNGFGEVFSLNTNGVCYTEFHDFSPTIIGTNGASLTITTNGDGAFPSGGLVLLNSSLYGAASEGGVNGCGVLFNVSPPPPVLSAQLSGGNFLLSFQAFSGMSYTVQQNTNLVGSTWTMFTNFKGSNSVTQFTLPATQTAQSFFRVRQP